MRRDSEPLEFGFPANGKGRFNMENQRSSYSGARQNGLAKQNDHGADPLDQDSTAIIYKGPARAQHPSTSGDFMSSNASSTQTSSFPKPINARRQIDQQRKEQRAWSSLLQGAATFIFGTIALCVALAAFGGYVLWKQIDNQSVTIGLLETNMRQQVQQLRSEAVIANEKLIQELDSANLKLNALTAQIEEQRDTIKNLNTTVEGQKAKFKQQETQMSKLSTEVTRLKNR